MQQEYDELLSQALAYFNLPPIFAKDSAELQPLKEKYGDKLGEIEQTEEDTTFSLTKLLAPLIEGR